MKKQDRFLWFIFIITIIILFSTGIVVGQNSHIINVRFALPLFVVPAFVFCIVVNRAVIYYFVL
jgi:membrane-associated HD superfamily phosphohydrolase